MQSEATPRLAPLARRAAISVTRMRAPEAPIGWPSAQAVDVDLLVGEAEIAHRRHRHHGESLVDLEEVDRVMGPAGLGKERLERADRGGREVLWRGGVRCVRDDAGERLDPVMRKGECERAVLDLLAEFLRDRSSG